MLPPGYLPFAAIAPGTQSTNDGHSDFDAGFAEGHAKAVAAMSGRLEWLSHEWRAQQSVVQQIFVQARNVPGVREAAALAAQLAASQPAQLLSPQPSSASALSRSRRPSDGNVVHPEHTGGVAPPAQAWGEAWVANGAAKAGGAGEEMPTAVLTKLQLEVSALLAANQSLRQENMEMLREIFPCVPAL